MDLEKARRLAEMKLRELESADDVPLRLDWDEGRGIQERSWCWIIWFNGQQWFETGDDFDSVLSGPIVVNKDGSDVWVAGTHKPADELLDEYGAGHAYESSGRWAQP